jgi:hypothetical protein
VIPEIPTEFLSENLRGRDQMGDIDFDRMMMMILKAVMIKLIASLWTDLM